MPLREHVTFAGDAAKLTGHLFLPDLTGTDDAAPVPGVVVAGTWTSVKEQLADRYAEQLARRGFAALSFDFTGYGESAGEPRDYESPELKIRDIRAAADFLTGHPAVSDGQLGALGVCAGAMYASAFAAEDSRVRSLALVAPWLHDRRICEENYGGPEGIDAKKAAAAEARRRYEETGEVAYVPVVSGSDPDAAMPFDIDFYLNPERGGIPQWPNRFAVMAWPGWLDFDAVAIAPKVTAPVLLVHSEDAAVPDGARRFHDGLAGPGQVIWTEGVQFDFYDQSPQVGIASDAAAEHFARTL
ncbi:alpha/beta hydrolase [Streptomyces sp. NBC_01186]|uniref:alpha/beta hydrolase n=1 Tax=unclassified Streptomyces TaxID=2593676 RepID=UPI002DD98CE1|nr:MULTISPECIES: alpha/beta fold hydrolase [unclassified Streptomyces]WSB79616.1 alpha/beta hydrolase [Streptomyces sp. NBC_01775]WSS12181.1 alpha/beta hydrolase [Streptomyces sp. NBC_01186]